MNLDYRQRVLTTVDQTIIHKHFIEHIRTKYMHQKCRGAFMWELRREVRCQQ